MNKYLPHSGKMDRGKVLYNNYYFKEIFLKRFGFAFCLFFVFSAFAIKEEG